MLRRRLRHVKRVGGHAVANDLRQDRSATSSGMLELFKNHDARSFSHYKSVTVFIPRTAGTGWIVVARRESAHRRESANAHRCNCRFPPAGDHHVSIAMLNDAVGIANRMRTGGARRRRRLIRTLGAK